MCFRIFHYKGLSKPGWTEIGWDTPACVELNLLIHWVKTNIPLRKHRMFISFRK